MIYEQFLALTEADNKKAKIGFFTKAGKKISKLTGVDQLKRAGRLEKNAAAAGQTFTTAANRAKNASPKMKAKYADFLARKGEDALKRQASRSQTASALRKSGFKRLGIAGAAGLAAGGLAIGHHMKKKKAAAKED